MTTGTSISIEGDDADTPMSNIVSLFGPDEPMLLGDIVAAFVLPELALRMRGNFDLPRIMVRPAWED